MLAQGGLRLGPGLELGLGLRLGLELELGLGLGLPLLEQVGRLLHELGLQPEAGLATGTAEPAVQPRAAMAVQTSTAKPNYFALLQEQKRKDGLL